MKQTNFIKCWLFAVVVMITFSCSQPKTDTVKTETASGDFDRTVLPILPHAFAGTVDTNASQSKPDFSVEVNKN